MKLYVVFYNRKTDQYGAPSNTIILMGENEEDAKQRATPLLRAPGLWISDVKEANHVMAAEKDIDIAVLPAQADAASAT